MNVHSPTTLDAALKLIAEDGRLRLVAGGTDLLVHWHDQAKDDWSLLDLSRLESELRTTQLTSDALELGALATYWDVIVSPGVATEFPLLVQAARQVGAVQIQTRGTWAGNIGNGSPAADGVLAMMAYDASVVLQSSTGHRDVPLAEYYTGYKQTVKRDDELIAAIRIPRRQREHEWFHKVGARRAQAISKVGVAIVKDAAGWRVVANSVAPTVCRCPAIERVLSAGLALNSVERVRDELVKDVSPIDDLRSTADYRIDVLSRLVFFWLRDLPQS